MSDEREDLREQAERLDAKLEALTFATSREYRRAMIYGVLKEAADDETARLRARVEEAETAEADAQRLSGKAMRKLAAAEAMLGAVEQLAKNELAISETADYQRRATLNAIVAVVADAGRATVEAVEEAVRTAHSVILANEVRKDVVTMGSPPAAKQRASLALNKAVDELRAALDALAQRGLGER
jgi:hypothetical protein